MNDRPRTDPALDAGAPHPLALAPMFANVAPALLRDLEAGLERVRIAPGEVLVRQGDPADAMYVLLSGELEVRVAEAGVEGAPVDRLGPGAAVGEMALVAGGRRSATVRAATPAELVRLSRTEFERLVGEQPDLYDAVLRAMAPRLQRVQLSAVLHRWFGPLESPDLHALQDSLIWVHLAAGEALYDEGDPGDVMYLLVSGRLRRSRTSDGVATVLGEVARGDAVGAYAVLADAPRAERVTALRDAYLVRVDRDLVAAHPQVIARIARAALERGRSPTRGAPRSGNGVRTVALLPTGGSAHAAAVADGLLHALRTWGRPLRLDAAEVDAAFGRDGVAQAAPDAPSHAALTHWLNEQEAAHDQVLFVADATTTNWTRRCLRAADTIVLVADAAGDATMGPAEREAAAADADLQLVLVHPDGATAPSGSARWLDGRPGVPFHHLRPGHGGDAGRLARRLTGRAVGLALSGGGARGYTHIGLIRAIEEAGLEVDRIAGTSMGALVGGAYAFGGDFAFCHRTAVAFGDRRKLVDRTLPLLALTRSRGVTELFRTLFGDRRIEDLWIPFECVSANLTRAEPVVHRTGPLWEAVRASTAIPGVFTPLIRDGDVLVDGGVMNAFPVDLMREAVGPGIVIGSDASSHGSRGATYDFGPSVSGWRVLLQRALPPSRRVRYPSILGILMRSTSLGSKHASARARSLADLVVEYPTHTFGGLDFDRYDELIELGYDAGGPLLRRWLEEAPAAAAPAAGA